MISQIHFRRIFLKHCSLLIIEDEVDLLTLYHDIAELYFDQVFVASSINEAKSYLKRFSVSSILIDNNLPDGIGINLLDSYKNIPSMIISGNTSPKIMQKAIDLSVYKYLIKPDDLKDLHHIFEDFRTYIDGQEKIKERVSRIDMSPATEAELVQKFNITPRELMIIQTSLLVDGNQEIAEKLKISPETVKKHWRNIFNKTNLRSRKAIHHFVYKCNESLLS